VRPISLRAASLLPAEISSWSVEKRYIHKNGRTVWARVHVSLVRGQHQSPQYFISVIEDINDRIQAEQALRDREERLRLALSAGVGVWDCDLQGKTAALSPQYRGVFGQLPPSFADWFKLVHPDDRGRVKALAQASIDRGGVNGSLSIGYCARTEL
jgi:PAS domain-containing protein